MARTAKKALDITIRIPAADVPDIRSAAEITDRSLEAFVLMAVDRFVDALKKTDQYISKISGTPRAFGHSREGRKRITSRRKK